MLLDEIIAASAEYLHVYPLRQRRVSVASALHIHPLAPGHVLTLRSTMHKGTIGGALK